MPGHDIIVVGSSAGGIEALQQLVAGFPQDLAAAVLIVQHIPALGPTMLPAILKRHSKLAAVSPKDQEEISHGRIYVAPPDHHLLIDGTRLRVVRGPRENRHRPAIDPLFRSAAWSCGPRVVGVVLSGTMDDGTAGLWAVKSCGGTTIVQDPKDALFPDMPLSAIRHVEIDHCLPLREIPPLLAQLSTTPVTKEATRGPEALGLEVKAAMQSETLPETERIGKRSIFSCPSCKGSLWEIDEGNLKRYRCHIGHSYLPEALLEDQTEAIRGALYAALATMEEKAAMLRRIAAQLSGVLPKEKERYEDIARHQDEQAALLRQLLVGG